MPEILATALPELASDIEPRTRAERFIGSVITGRTVDVELKAEIAGVSPIESLYDALKMLHDDPEHVEAKHMVRTNVASDVIERTIKSGHIRPTRDLLHDASGRIYQHGQTMRGIQENSLLYASNSPMIRPRTEAETRNLFRTEQLLSQGQLENNLMLTVSLTDIGKEDDLKKANFFTETMSTSLQAVTVEDGKLVMKTAFIAGKKSANSERHDLDMVQNLGVMLGVDFSGMTPAEILDTPLLISKKHVPNGLIDIVAMTDRAAGGDTFFGEYGEAADYIAFEAECNRREEQYDRKVDAITADLIAQADIIDSPIEAYKALDRLSHDHMLQQAIGDRRIDARVFGPAADLINQARYQYEHQEFAAMQSTMTQVRHIARSSNGCPIALDMTETNGEEDIKPTKTTLLKSCEFMSRECPKCHKKNVWTTVDAKGKYSGSCGCKA